MTEFRRLPYGRQTIDEEDVQAVARALRGDWLTTGPLVDEFEEALAQRAGVAHAVAVNSGTAALHAAYFAAGIGDGDEIITSPLTFVATASTAIHLGARVRFCDIDERTGNLDAKLAAEQVNEATKLLVPVDYAGHPADYRELGALARKRGLEVIADAAHSFGASYHGEPVGSLADATTTSFHPVKLMTTAEGGALFTQSDDWARRAAEFRNHGIVRREASNDSESPGWYHEIRSLGLNYRIPDVLCALGLSQLTKVKAFIERRREIAARYAEGLADVPGLQLPVVLEGVAPAWHLYVIRVVDPSRRDALFARLREKGCGVQLHYIPIHLQPVFRDLGHRTGECPIAERFAEQALSVPIYPTLSDSDLDWSIGTIREVSRELL